MNEGVFVFFFRKSFFFFFPFCLFFLFFVFFVFLFFCFFVFLFFCFLSFSLGYKIPPYEYKAKNLFLWLIKYMASPPH